MEVKKPHPLIKILCIVWTLPNTIFGLFVGLIGICSGGGWQFIEGCIEFHGGLIKTYLDRNRITAMTLGHVIIGQTPAGLAFVRPHEHVHVRQYERWGPLFIPAYLLCSAYLWCQGRECYRNNPFEVEAYQIDDPSQRRRAAADNDQQR